MSIKKDELDSHVETEDQEAAPPRNTCEQCAQPFGAKRADARYCSPSCRAKASRARRDAPPEPVRATQPRGAARSANEGIPPSVARRLAQLEATVAAQDAELRDASKALDARIKRIETTKPPTSAFEIITKFERELEPIHKRLDRLGELLAAPKTSTDLGVRVQDLERTRVRRRDVEQANFEMQERLDQEVRRLDQRLEATAQALLQFSNLLPG